MPKPYLDAIDGRIVAELQADGRLSNVELADKVGLSPSPCLRRVKRLERDGYIEGYRAALRRDCVGLGFSVFLGVKIDGHTNERALAFEKAVVEMPEVIACHLVSGESDYFLEVVVPDLGAYQRFLVGKLLDLPIVREVRSNIAIQTLKAGAPLPLTHLEMEQSRNHPHAAKRDGRNKPQQRNNDWRCATRFACSLTVAQICHSIPPFLADPEWVYALARKRRTDGR